MARVTPAFGSVGNTSVAIRIDLPAPMAGFGHHGKRDERKPEDQVEVRSRKAPEMAKPPQLDPCGDPGEGEPEQRHQGYVPVDLDHRLGNPR
jgi:hypothetical protein